MRTHCVQSGLDWTWRDHKVDETRAQSRTIRAQPKAQSPATRAAAVTGAMVTDADVQDSGIAERQCSQRCTQRRLRLDTRSVVRLSHKLPHTESTVRDSKVGTMLVLLVLVLVRDEMHNSARRSPSCWSRGANGSA